MTVRFEVEEQQWTIAQVLLWVRQNLCERGGGIDKTDSEHLLAHCLGCKRIDLYINYQMPLSAQERQSYKLELARLAAGVPLAYIIGNADFYGYEFVVGPEVLIPRPDTECLIEQVLDYRHRFDESPRSLEIGLGSGCISITLAKEIPSLSATGWDVDAGALEIACSNASRHQVKVEFTLKDGLSHDSYERGAFDFIVSNPPYISTAAIQELDESVREYEPTLALSGGGDGLKFYKRFSVLCQEALKPRGMIFLEIGFDQGKAVVDLFRDAGWADIQLKQDYGGRDRIVIATRS